VSKSNSVPIQGIVSKCILCGAPNPSSEEHLIPLWFWKAIAKAGFPYIKYRNYDLITPKWEYIENLVEEPNDASIPVLCSDCNTGWGRRLQYRSSKLLKPFVIGEWTVLNKDQRKQIANWFTNYLMVREMLSSNLITHTQEIREEFRNEYQIPQTLSIWIAPLKHPDYGSSHTAHIDDTVEIIPGFANIHITIQELGMIALVGFGAPVKGVFRKNSLEFKTLCNYLASIGFIPIWLTNADNKLDFPKIKPTPALYTSPVDLYLGMIQNLSLPFQNYPFEWVYTVGFNNYEIKNTFKLYY
jgi:hypothetical protein